MRTAIAAITALLVSLLVAASPAIAAEDPYYEEVVLHYTGDYQDVPIPSWAKNAIVVAVGGRGGSGEGTWGGRGTRVQGTIPAAGVGKITVGVGASGGTTYTGPDFNLDWLEAKGGWGGGGAHGGTSKIWGYRLTTIAGGGGATNVMLRGLEVIVAGGGGGAGATVNATGGEGGGNSAGHQGHGVGAAKGGAGGAFASQPSRVGGNAEVGGAGGGGYVGGGGGQPGGSVFLEAGAGGGAAGTSWTAPIVSNVFTSTADAGGPDGNGFVKIFFLSQ